MTNISFSSNMAGLATTTAVNESDSISIADKIEILYKFSKSILDNIKDIEPEYSVLVDEHFWDLL